MQWILPIRETMMQMGMTYLDTGIYICLKLLEIVLKKKSVILTKSEIMAGLWRC